jgi:hypothetical protein
VTTIGYVTFNSIWTLPPPLGRTSSAPCLRSTFQPKRSCSAPPTFLATCSECRCAAALPLRWHLTLNVSAAAAAASYSHEQVANRTLGFGTARQKMALE